MVRRARASCLGVLLGGGFYLLLIDTVQSPELYAGAGATLIAALAFEASREQGFAEAALPARGLARAWRVLIRLPVDIGLVAVAAITQLFRSGSGRGSRGQFRAVRFDAGGAEETDAGRRALAEALGSLTPNTIVVGVDPDSRLILVHQLERRGGREQLDPLELG
jgi:multisubunit Na+/H+ antiporter MnhE subunit